MKLCTLCGVTKPLTDYNLDKTKPDGHYPRCRPCVRIKNIAYYAANKEKVQAKLDAWSKAHPDAVRKSAAKFYKTPKGKATRLRSWKAYYARYPEKRKAGQAVRDAVFRGKLVRPKICSECSGTGLIHAHHHKGYAKEYQLDVAWLCKPCHDLAHK